jgi:Helix-turn-helix domain
MPRYAWNKAPSEVRRRYFGLIRSGLSGSVASQRVGVSLSCGSLWFIDAGQVSFVDAPISPRFLSQDDRIEIADGLARGEPVKVIAARIGKSYQSLYREITRNSKPDGRYQPWYAHGQAYLRRRRPRARVFEADAELAAIVAGRLARAVVARADLPVAAPPLSAQATVARLCRDDLRGGLPGPDHPGLAAAAAHRPHLPASPRPRPVPRRSTAAVHGDQADRAASRGRRESPPGRALGISMLLSSCMSEVRRLGFAVGGAVSEHGPQDVQAAPGEGDEGLLVGFAFAAFAVVERP